MKINQKILSVPPYISTAWSNIASIHLDGKQTLIVTLHSGTQIKIPDLSGDVIEKIFAAHERVLESDRPKSKQTPTQPPSPAPGSPPSFSFGIPLDLAGEGVDPFGSIMQHNSQHADSPDLPPDVLKKIAAISSSLGISEDQSQLPKAEPHCNCYYCQIARAMENPEAVSEHQDNSDEKEELVSDEELTFKDWEIQQANDNLYIVSNPLNLEEHYQVFLGEPIGCTCGEKNCEHIRTVLNS